MSYTDARYSARHSRLVADPNTATGTITASGANTLATAFPLPSFRRRTQINDVRVVVKTAPAANLTSTVLAFLNGTSTFATATIGTNTANSVVVGSVNSTLGTFTASAQPTVTVIGTGTASAQSYGAYEVFMEAQELYE